MNSERPAIRRDGFVELASLLQRVAQIVVRFRIVGFQFERAGDTRPRLRRAGLARQRDAQIIVGLRVVRFEFERAAIRGHGFVELA